MPQDYTICAAYMEEKTLNFPINLFTLTVGTEYSGSFHWAFVQINPTKEYTKFILEFDNVHFEVVSPFVLFPLTWIHVCVSVDTVLQKVKLVVDGRLLDERVDPMTRVKGLWKPSFFNIRLGDWGGYNVENSGMISMVNIFALPLSSESMVSMTQAGNDDCGAHGDYVNWEKSDWQLHSMARFQIFEVGQKEDACRKESEVTVYPAGFKYHSAATNIDRQGGCMEHCQKIGKGRSPSMQTLDNWKWLEDEVKAITPTQPLNAEPYPWPYPTYMWLAITDEETEAVWRDSYHPHEKIETGWIEEFWKIQGLNSQLVSDKGEALLGDTANCLTWNLLATYKGEKLEEDICVKKNLNCPCKTKQQPILRLRGLCNGLDSPINLVYTPKQLPMAPTDLILLGRTSTIKYRHNQWVLTDSMSNVTAVSNAVEESYVLGKQEWNITNDAFLCGRGQPYYQLLKLSGCNPDGEFTCNDGQCVTMEKRCDQIPNCRDKSDEEECHLLIRGKGYNKLVPPFRVNVTDESIIPVDVNISINLLKVIDMEEQDHKIDLQFEITLEWRENDRIVFHNLKEKSSTNALSEDNFPWLPRVFYDNTDMKLVTRGGMGWEWPTVVSVNRDGGYDSCESNPSCRRSGLEEMEEIEIFEGGQNTMKMQQVYTLEFQCQYDLQYYPFDTQVTSRLAADYCFRSD